MEPSLERLLQEVWPRLGPALSRARSWGAPWASVSRAFTERDADGAVISHVGVIPVELMIAGERVVAAGLHAVSTAEAHRRRGLASGLLQRALAACEAEGRTTQLLFAVDPSFYARFGFVPVQPSVMVPRRVPPPRARSEDRSLELGREGDRLLLEALLRRRTLTSRRFAVAGPEALFLLDASLAGALMQYVYLPDSETIVAYRSEGTLLRVADVIGPEPPPLAELVERIPARRSDVAFDLEVDALDDDLGCELEWTVLEETPMVRGPFAVGDPVFSPLWRW